MKFFKINEYIKTLTLIINNLIKNGFIEKVILKLGIEKSVDCFWLDMIKRNSR